MLVIVVMVLFARFRAVQPLDFCYAATTSAPLLPTYIHTRAYGRLRGPSAPKTTTIRKGVDKKKRNRRKMTPAEHLKRHKTKSIATIFKSTSAADDDGVLPGVPGNQLGNASEDIDKEQPTELNDTRGDEGCQKIDTVLDESVPQLSSNKSKGEELQIQQTTNSNIT